MDARKSLQVLQNEWERCMRCDLGVHRHEVGGRFVFGEGVARGILFVGEGPGRNEEDQGRPFVGDSGTILRAVINKFGLKDYYITNVVACRSCEMLRNTDGTPMLSKAFPGRPAKPRYKDIPPLPVHVAACMPRIHEQIYLLDPIVIVSLGAGAATALTGKNVAITVEAGKERHITVPGASAQASLTEKKGVWLRKHDGKLINPIEQTEVRYLLIPTFHPAYVLRQHADQRPGKNATFQFAADIRKAVRIYERYMLEVFNTVVSTPNVTDDEVVEAVDRAQEVPEEEQEHYYGQ